MFSAIESRKSNMFCIIWETVASRFEPKGRILSLDHVIFQNKSCQFYAKDETSTYKKPTFESQIESYSYQLDTISDVVTKHFDTHYIMLNYNDHCWLIFIFIILKRFCEIPLLFPHIFFIGPFEMGYLMYMHGSHRNWKLGKSL